MERVLFGLVSGWRHLDVPAAMPASAAFCLGLLGISLLGKLRWPRITAGLDLFVVFVSFSTALGRAFGTPVPANAHAGSQVGLLGALFLLILTTGHMAAYPAFRPLAYFFENSSAGRVQRRILPVTLAFPLLLVWLQYEARHGAVLLSRVGGLLFLVGIIAFWVALIWLVSNALDRVDLTHLTSETELRANEERLRLLLESTSEGIYSVNLEGVCRWCNPAAVRLLGYSRSEDLMGRQMHDLTHHTRPDGEAYPLDECAVMLAAARGESYNVDEELLWRADGTNFYASFRSNPVVRNGRVEALVVTFADVSRRRGLEEQLRQSQKMEAVGRLAAGIAHDFNNLLTVINGYSDMLLRQDLPSRTHEKAENIHKAGVKAATLTQQLLAFSRQQVLQPKILDLNAVLRDMTPLLLRVIGEDMQLEFLPASELAAVKADPNQLEQVLMNLVVNARDAMPRGGKLTIETENVVLDKAYASSHAGVTPGPYTMLAVTDTGTGMSDEVQAHIFEPFFTTKPDGKGTGLGLSTVFGIVKQSGGSLAVYSELGHGTSFKVYLPSVSARPSTAEPEVSPLQPKSQGTILVLEDEKELGSLVQEILESDGYRVLRAHRPEEALAICRDYPGRLDLLISDIILPGMNGREVAGQIIQQRPETRVLFISGYPDGAVMRNGALDPSLSFIQKPFTTTALVQKTRQLLSRVAA